MRFAGSGFAGPRLVLGRTPDDDAPVLVPAEGRQSVLDRGMR